MTETATNERGLICTGEQVRAILNGATQFRRPMEPQPIADDSFEGGGYISQPTPSGSGECRVAASQISSVIRCPYGVPGDRLWVQEIYHHDWEHGRYFYQADADTDGTVPYLVSGIGGSGGGVGSANIPESEWMPADAMDRHQSRITLEVKRVWVERVQEMSEDDAYAEGYKPDSFYRELDANCAASRTARLTGDPADSAAKAWFRDLWDSINASKGYGWDANPWVWCVKFERVEDGR